MERDARSALRLPPWQGPPEAREREREIRASTFFLRAFAVFTSPPVHQSTMRAWLDDHCVGERGGDDRLELLKIMSTLASIIRCEAVKLYNEELERIRVLEDPDLYEPDYEFVVSRATVTAFSNLNKTIASIAAWKAVRLHFKKKNIAEFWNKLAHKPTQRNLKRLCAECLG